MTAGFARIALLALLAVLPGACQRAGPAQEEEAATGVFARPDDLPPFTLQPMGVYEMGDFEQRGDKRCSFATNPALPPLLVATGFLRQPTSPVDVLVKYGGQIVEGEPVTPGGFDAIRDEATFDTGGMIIDVARITQEPDGSGPAPQGRALLRVTMAGQEQEIIAGYWTCTV
ncbi:MAG: hypothetical protein V4647_04095 [Pseudomonadota bacterium]